MANRTLTADIIAAEALMILDNNLVMAISFIARKTNLRL